MQMHVEKMCFPLAKPFSITGHTFVDTETVRVTLTDGDVCGRGESVGSYYLGETADSMLAQLEEIAAVLPEILTADAIQDLLPACGARNALDCAYWDFRAKASGRGIWELLTIKPRTLCTVFTIGMDSADNMRRFAVEAAAYPQLKIKVDGTQPIEKLEAIRDGRPDADLIIDVNQGWTFEELKEYLPHCKRLDIRMIEQPLARGADAMLEGFKSPVPLGADESCLHLGEFKDAAARYDVLNIKLDKCGGLSEGLALVSAAQRTGMKLMVGNMTGTSLSMAPSFIIGTACVFVDLDGPLLLARDIDDGLMYGSGGSVEPPAPALWG